MKNHGLWMMIGCGLPLLLIFILSAVGVSGSVSLFIFIVLMFGMLGCHLLMQDNHHEKHDKHDDEKEMQRECH